MHKGSLEDNVEVRNEDNPNEARHFKKRSPLKPCSLWSPSGILCSPPSLAKEGGLGIGKSLNKFGKVFTKIPILFPFNLPFTAGAKVLGTATKGAAKLGQILL